MKTCGGTHPGLHVCLILAWTSWNVINASSTRQTSAYIESSTVKSDANSIILISSLSYVSLILILLVTVAVLVFYIRRRLVAVENLTALLSSHVSSSLHQNASFEADQTVEMSPVEESVDTDPTDIVMTNPSDTASRDPSDTAVRDPNTTQMIDRPYSTLRSSRINEHNYTSIDMQDPHLATVHDYTNINVLNIP